MYRKLSSAAIALLLLLSTITFIQACKPEIELTEEEKTAQQLKEDATYNNSILPGAGSLLYEANLKPNTLSQLVAKMAYKNDTIALYGTVNASGKLEYIHTSIVAKKGGTELIVTEIYPETSTSRMYTIANNQKGRFVLEKEHLSATDFTLNILDHDWTSGESKTLASFYFSNGVRVAALTENVIIGGQSDVWNCDKPQPADDLSQRVHNYLEYFQCGGLAWDSHPTLELIKESVKKGYEKIKLLEEYKDKLGELELLNGGLGDISQYYNSLLEKLPSFKFRKIPLDPLLKKLEELYKK